MITILESETNKLKIFWAIETMAVIQGGISSTILNMIQPLATEMSAMDAELSMLKDKNNLTILAPNPETPTAITDRIKIIEDKQTELFKKLNLNALEATSKDPIANGDLGSGQEDEDTPHQTMIEGTGNTSKILDRIPRSPTNPNPNPGPQTQGPAKTPAGMDKNSTVNVLKGINKYLMTRNLNDCLSCHTVYLTLATYACFTIIQCFLFLVLCCRSTGSRQAIKGLKADMAETKQRLGMVESNLLQANQRTGATAAAAIRSSSRTTPRFLPSAPALY